MTPLVLLVGFLGSGKTTYLRKLLPALQSGGLDPHVIINDYQNARVDAALLQDLTNSVLPISGSCVCCGSREELLSALDAFEHAPKRVLIVETNGTTDSEELIELLSLEPSLSRFTLPIQLSVIDGQRWQKRFWHNALELDQARTASHVFVSRLEEIDKKRGAQLESSLCKHGITPRRLAPAAFALELALITGEVNQFENRQVAAEPASCGCGHDHHGDEGHRHDHGHHEEHDHPHDHAHDHDHDHAHTSHHFASLQIDLPEVVTRKSLEHFLDRLPVEVIRAKGLVRLTESPEEYHVFQKVERSVQLLPIGNNNRFRHSVSVFIGPQIPEDSVRAGVVELFAAQT